LGKIPFNLVSPRFVATTTMASGSIALVPILWLRLSLVRSTMGQDRLQQLAVIAIVRDMSIRVLENDLDKIVDSFASVGNCQGHFF
jgi:hypothetical protein